jgi:exopolyphosphatase/guanosine-5'-triphosphate,3'-diphosphate pyrophosphatase
MALGVPFAIIDLGSNTVRLVVFERVARFASALLNERVFCGLGRGLGGSGRLDDVAIPPLMVTLERFHLLAASLGAGEVTVLATAAVREAKNGSELVQRIRDRFKSVVLVLSGAEEAKLSAAGVLFGFPDADGVMADLGGGSLELVDLPRGRVGDSASLPLGSLRLAEVGRASASEAAEEIAGQLKRVAWLDRLRDRDFYAVGGAWRALAQLHMNETGYPVHMVHGYTLGRKEAGHIASRARAMGKDQLARIEGIADRRLETLPYGAAVLDEILARAKPARVVFSATGLREGYLYDRLDRAERDKDPLVVAAEAMGGRAFRDSGFWERLEAWTRPLFPGEQAAETRLRRVACVLANIGWREHPDYRADQVFSRIMHFPFLALAHADRAALAAALYVRCGGKIGKAPRMPALALLGEDDQERAVVLGLALRLAYAVSGGAPPILDGVQLRPQGKRLELVIDGHAVAAGPQIEKAFKALVRAARFADGRIVTAGG